MFPSAVSSAGKKLNDVARWFVGELATESTTLTKDEAHFGGPVVSVKKPAQLWVLPTNWKAAQALSIASTQWQYDKDSVEIALDYARADVAWRYSNLLLSNDDFERVQTLERMILGLIRRPDEQQSEFGVTLSV